MPPGTSPQGGESSPPNLLAQFHQAVHALNELVSALRDVAKRPPVHMQVEKLELDTLEFHLGDIDVQELRGEMNIGITHSLKVAAPKRENLVKLQLPKDTTVKRGSPKDLHIQMDSWKADAIILDRPKIHKLKKPKDDELKVRPPNNEVEPYLSEKTASNHKPENGKEPESWGLIDGLPKPKTLSNSYITRLRQQAKPAGPSLSKPIGGKGGEELRADGGPEQPGLVLIWPPADVEGKEKP
jgi:hypothetical protein